MREKTIVALALSSLVACLGLAVFVGIAYAHASPIPFCPGDGVYVYVLGAEAAGCDFAYQPDPVSGRQIHTHCDWGGWGVGEMFRVADGARCDRFYADGTMVPKPAPPQWDSTSPPDPRPIPLPGDNNANLP